LGLVNAVFKRGQHEQLCTTIQQRKWCPGGWRSKQRILSYRRTQQVV